MRKAIIITLVACLSTGALADTKRKDAGEVIMSAMIENMEKNCSIYSAQMMLAVDSLTASEDPVTTYQNNQKFEQLIARGFEKEPTAQAVGIGVAKLLLSRAADWLKSGRAKTPKTDQEEEAQNYNVLQTEFLSCLKGQINKRKISNNESCWLDEQQALNKQSQRMPFRSWVRITEQKCRDR